jgi:hypothetical protein
MVLAIEKEITGLITFTKMHRLVPGGSYVTNYRATRFFRGFEDEDFGRHILTGDSTF